MDNETIHLILGAIDAGGTIAVMVVMLVLFFRGDIISRAIITDIIEATVTEVMKRLDEPRE